MPANAVIVKEAIFAILTSLDAVKSASLSAYRGYCCEGIGAVCMSLACQHLFHRNSR